MKLRDDLRTGIASIDKQHIHFFLLLSKIDEFKKIPCSKETLVNYIAEIIELADEYFNTEEYIMRSIKYPLFEEHYAKHNFFRGKMDNYYSESKLEDLNILDFLTKIDGWILY
jgi:hemerythrin-like metal-binding protein